MIEAGPRLAQRSIRLRDGGPEDMDEVMRIMDGAFAPCFGEGWTRSQCLGILPMSGVTLTVAEEAGEAVGFALVRSVADESELLLIAVDPGHQHGGIGKRLLDHFIEEGRAQGIERLHLEVRDGNPAVALYSSAGFEQAGRRRGYYRGPQGERHDALTLVLTR